MAVNDHGNEFFVSFIDNQGLLTHFDLWMKVQRNNETQSKVFVQVLSTSKF